MYFSNAVFGWVHPPAFLVTSYMLAARTFVDTNVLVYAHNADAGPKHDAAKRRVAELWAMEDGVLSVQVLQELYVNVTRKIPRPLDRATARELLRVYGAWLCAPTGLQHIVRASEIEEANKLSFWDSLIIVSAATAGASVLLTEDLNHGQVVEGVRIENPFRQ